MSLVLQICLAIALLGASATQAGVIVDVSSSGDVGTTITLDAGVYNVSFVGTSDGGAYNAWNAWGPSASSGCGTVPGSCATGWLDAVQVDVGGVNASYYIPAPFSRGGPPAIEAIYATELESLAAYQAQFNPFVLSLAQASNVRFWILDTGYADNFGGVSLNVEAVTVPEPGALSLFAAGLIVLGLMRRVAFKQS